MNILKSNEIYDFLKNLNRSTNLKCCLNSAVKFLCSAGAEFAWIMLIDFSTNKPLMKIYSSCDRKAEAEKLNKIIEGYFEQSLDSDEVLEFINSKSELEPIIVEGSLCGVVGAFGYNDLKIFAQMLIPHIEIFIIKEKNEFELQERIRFLASISHEFKTPLNSIIGFGELLNLHNRDSALNRYISNISLAAGQLLGLIKDVLELARSQTNDMELLCEKFYPREDINEILESLQPQIDEKKLSVEMDLSDMVLMADKNRFRQLVTNLITNAVKFNKIGGKITILLFINKSNKLQCEVKDTGEGISKNDYGKIFKFFSQVSRDSLKRKNGSGIGLFLCKKIVEAHGGVIDFKSRLNSGSTFRFILPLTQNVLQ